MIYAILYNNSILSSYILVKSDIIYILLGFDNNFNRQKKTIKGIFTHVLWIFLKNGFIKLCCKTTA